MSTVNETKLKKLLFNLPKNTIITSKYLSSIGISYDLQKRYEQNGWLKRIYQGAYIKPNETCDVNGALNTLQYQLGLSFHAGSLSALNNFYGITHNISFNKKQQLFAYRGEKVPKWFQSLYENEVEIYTTTFLPKDIGITEYNTGYFNIKISTLERAVLEMLYLVPDKITANEAYQILELLTTVKPKEFQKLLENCSSIKVNRLFLYLADTISHPWFKKLDIAKIKLGNGVREITAGGKFNAKYNIIIDDIEEI